MIAEQVHRYSRWLTWPIELLCTLAVGATAILFGRDLLTFLWINFDLDTTLFKHIPLLFEIVTRIKGIKGYTTSAQVDKLPEFIPVLTWLALALLLALLLRNALPTIRTSARGILVEFSGGWLPVPWESLQAIKVTEDLNAERFVLLAETEGSRLTGWHRIYSLIYRFGFRRGFLIISAISDFDSLIKTLLNESDRVARVLDNAKPAQLQEGASSPLFRFLLSPASFLSQRSQSEIIDLNERPGSGSEAVQGTYPARINAIFTWGTNLLGALLLLRYVIYLLTFLALTIKPLRSLPLFNQLALPNIPGEWWYRVWLLIAAHLLVFVMFYFLSALRNLLPNLAIRREGLAVRNFGRWIIVPWAQITTVKVTEFSEESQIVLIQTSGRLPFMARMSSLLYDGSLAPGLLVTSAISNFEAIMQQIVIEVTRNQTTANSSSESPIFQSDARSIPLLLLFHAGTTIDKLVDESRMEEQNKEFKVPLLLRSAGPMFWLALPLALLLFFERAIAQGLLPDGRLVLGMIMIFLLGMLEWPLVILLTMTLEETTGGGEEGYRGTYLYPLIQIPRLLPFIGSIVFVLLGIPIVPTLLWLAAIGWSFLLAAGLWEALYDWHGGQLLAGGLIPVGFQLLILLAYLIVRG